MRDASEKKDSTFAEEFRTVLSNRTFLLCVILLSVLAYGFAALNITVGIDDLEAERYVGSGNAMLYGGRFTITLLSVLFGYGGRVLEHAYLVDILSVIGLILSAVNFCVLFRGICGKNLSDAGCIVFSGVFVTYPLHLEIWEYTGGNLSVAFGFFCVSAAALHMYHVLHCPSGKKRECVAVAGLLLMLACAGYESLVPVYIFTVFAVLALQVIYGSPREKKLLEILRQGICYAAVLLLGLVLRVVVHQVILAVLGGEAQNNGATVIMWGTKPASEIVVALLLSWLKDYLLKAVIYFPLTELVVAAAVLFLIGLWECRSHGWTLLLPGVGMYLTLIILALVQGEISPYRTCQVFAVFVAFTAMLLVMMVDKWKKPKLSCVLLLVCAVLCFHQARYVDYFLTLNHMRSEEDAFVARTVARDLQEISDEEQTVIFVGTYRMSDYLEEAASIPETSLRWRAYRRLCRSCEQIDWDTFNKENLSRKLPQTNVNSVLYWAQRAFEQESIQKVMSYYGYTYHLEYDFYGEAKDFAAAVQMPAYPQEGYIQDEGRFLVVRME